MKLKITVDGKAYEVDVEVMEREAPPISGGSGAAGIAVRPGAAPVAAAPVGGGAGDVAVADEAKACRSPLAGNVVRVDVKVGDDVAADATVMVLEAMKMETSITAPLNGKVKLIHANVGEAVKQGQVLVEFE